MIKPYPGSEQAIKVGCTCPVFDNNYGDGFSKDENGQPLFWVSSNCPIHYKKETQNEE